MIYDRDPNLNFLRWTKNGTIGRVRNQNSGPEALMDDLWPRSSGLTSQAPCGFLELEGSMIINLALVGSVSVARSRRAHLRPGFGGPVGL